MHLIYASILALCVFGAACAQPPLSVYGSLPNVDRMDISPDGQHLAYILRSADAEGLFIFNVAAGRTSGGVKIEEGKVRRIFFAGPENVILQVSVTSTRTGFVGPDRYEYSSAISYDIETREFVRLLRNVLGIYESQGGLGRIIGIHEGRNEVFMPAWAGEAGALIPDYEVFSVNLDTGRTTSFAKGGEDAIDWFIDRDGTILAREDFSEKGDGYTIRTKRNGEWEKVFFANTENPPFFLTGIKSDKSALLGYEDPEEDGYSSLFELSFDGRKSDPVFSREDADIDRVLADINRFVVGVQYSGLYPTYGFSDEALAGAVASTQASFPGASVRLQSWTDDFNKLLFYVAGSRRAPAYYLYDRATQSMKKIASRYDGLSDADIGEIITIEYKASDGLRIPAIITLPPSVGQANNLPMIVMPHGGPEEYDSVGFYWLAQYFASRGYLVFQPNFRGSGGLGGQFRSAGYGEWGGKMQADVTDGVNLLIRNGWVDKERVCIIGASFGGYAALAGGANTPDLYKCIAAIAPVTDVKRMLRDVKRASGSNSLVFKYWEKLLGDLSEDRVKLDAISPTNHAANFKAPVLLIHGKDDTVVPISHSRSMEAALKAAGKPVELVELKGEDHWLSQGETRLQTLTELDKFVSETIGRPAQ